MRMDAKGIYYKELNELIRQAVDIGKKDIVLDNVNGQRYIGAGLSGEIKITINGVPGNDLAAFMDGPIIIVNSNGQDGIGNTMNAGKIIVRGDVGDIAGYSMRGGRIYIKGNAGYRVGIHMKSYKDLYPVIIIGGTAGDFLGEYMAGGLLVVLGLAVNSVRSARQDDLSENIVGNFIGTGMHGGSIFIRGTVNRCLKGKEIKIVNPTEGDLKLLKEYIGDFCNYFDIDLKEIFCRPFVKLYPYTHRPYGKLYAY